jgi:hypothetical protein
MSDHLEIEAIRRAVRGMSKTLVGTLPTDDWPFIVSDGENEQFVDPKELKRIRLRNLDIAKNVQNRLNMIGGALAKK